MPIISTVGANTPIPSNGATGLSALACPTPTFPHISHIADAWTLDAEQRRAFSIIALHASLPKEHQLKMLLTRVTSSGKSQVIKALCQFFEECNGCHQFHLAAFMGIAAHNIGGIMLHSVLNLNSRAGASASSAKSQHELQALWAGVRYLLIDEVSMISCKFMLRISDALIAATNIAEPFGGICIIFAGDLAQLPPVSKTWLSKKDSVHPNALSPSNQCKARGHALWLTINTVVILCGNNRQIGDHNLRFRLLLGRLCYGICTNKDYALLSSRIINRGIPHSSLNEFSFAPVIVCENAAKDAINNKFAQHFATTTSQVLHWYISEDLID
jgi:hypothetical protein